MTARPKPLPPENDEVVFGVSSVLLTGSAQFSAADDDAGAERVDLGGGRRGGVPAVEAWRQALRRDLNVLGLKTKTAILDEGRMAGVYLAEIDEPEVRRAADEAPSNTARRRRRSGGSSCVCRCSSGIATACRRSCSAGTRTHSKRRRRRLSAASMPCRTCTAADPCRSAGRLQVQPPHSSFGSP